MSTPPDSAPDSLTDSLLDALYAALELEAADRDAAIDALCDQHPQHASTLRDYAARARDTASMPCHEFIERLSTHPGSPDRYEVGEVIGRGGMGTVYRARDLHLDRDVAMKVIRPKRRNPDEDESVASQVLQRFVDEAQITGQLDHPGVVPVYQVGTGKDGEVWFTMRLVRGRTVDEILQLTHQRRDGWTTTRALEVIVKMCDTLAFAHSRQVVHRDLKPSNVMVGRFGEVYVMDWGLARVLTRADNRDLRIRPMDESRSRISTSKSREVESDPDSPLITMDGAVVGTPSFMSLEQAEGRVDQIGPRSDVYSVGGILYALLTGDPPYLERTRKTSPYTLLRAVLDGPPQPIRERAPHAQGELVAICEKAMSRDIHRRYTDCREMACDIRAFLEGRVVQAHRTGAVAEIRTWIRRNRALAFATLTALLMIAAGGIAWLTASNAASRAQREETLRGQAESARAAAELAKTQIEFARDRTRYARRLLEAQLGMKSDLRRARRALDSCAPTMRGPEWHVLRMQADTSTWRAEMPGNAPPQFVRFAARGARFLTAWRDRIDVWAPPAKQPVATFHHRDSGIRAIAASPDLSRIVAKGKRYLMVWEQGDHRPLLTTECKKFCASVDCRIIAFTHERAVTVWDRDSAKPFIARQYGASLTPREYLARAVTKPVAIAEFVPNEFATKLDAEGYSITAAGPDLRVERVTIPRKNPTVGARIVRMRRGHRKVLRARKARDAAEKRNLVAQYRGHLRDISAVIPSIDGHWTLTFSKGGALRLWSYRAITRTYGVEQSWLEPPITPRSIDWHEVTHASVSPSAQRAVTYTAENGLWLWDLQRMTPIDVVRGVRPIQALEFLDEDCILGIHADGSMAELEFKIDPDWRTHQKRLPPDLRKVVIAADGRRVFYATADQRIVGWSLESETEIVDLELEGRCSRLTTASDGTTIAWSEPNRVLVYDVDAGSLGSTVCGRTPSMLAIETEQRLLAIAAKTKIELLDLEDLQPFRRLDIDGDDISHVSFPHGGLTLFAVTSEGLAAWWSTSADSDPLATHRIGKTGRQVWIAPTQNEVWDLFGEWTELRRRRFAASTDTATATPEAESQARDLLAAPRYARLPTELQRRHQLERDSTLNPETRAAALRLARIDGDDVDALETKCWSIVSSPSRSREQYLDGLLTAEQLVARCPGVEAIQVDLGLALLRLQRFDEALAALDTGRIAGARRHRQPSLINLGLRAICLLHLDRHEAARDAAQRFQSSIAKVAKLERQRQHHFEARGAREPVLRLMSLRDEIQEELKELF